MTSIVNCIVDINSVPFSYHYQQAHLPEAQHTNALAGEP